jgi:O-antigen ligase
MNVVDKIAISDSRESLVDGAPLWKRYISISAVLWLMLWFAINTGPWILSDDPDNLVEWLHYIRTTFPLIVVVLGAGYYFQKRHGQGKIISGPVSLWLIYGIAGLLAATMSPEPFDAAYWAIAYLAVFSALCAYMYKPDNIEGIIQLNHLNWIITTIFLLLLVFFARDALLPVIMQRQSAYGIYGQMQVVAAMPMSRSSGMARFAAVPGVIAFVMFWHSGSLKRILWLSLFIFSVYLIYLMQSRGAIFGFAFAIAFVMLFQGKRSRILGIAFVSLFGLMLLSDVIPVDTINDIKDYIYRGQSEEDFRSMTGRTRAWESGVDAALESPLIGWGFQSDRLLIHEHVHNTYLYALITSGFFGVASFIAGLAWAWLLFWRIIKKGKIQDRAQKIFLIQAGGILAFFTVRSIPEVCGALFGVDFMIMLPILAYLKVASDKLDSKEII